MRSQLGESEKNCSMRPVTGENEISLTNEEELDNAINNVENNLQNDFIDRPTYANVNAQRRTSVRPSILFFHDMDTKARHNDLAHAMSFGQRIRKKVRKCLKIHSKKETQEIQGIEQYRIQPREEKYIVMSALGRILVSFIHWCYRSQLHNLILVFITIYFVVIVLFALILWKTAWLYFSLSQKECVTSFDYTQMEKNFEMAFDLSWTTFSTVGYGIVGPSFETNCWGVRVICALESFCGILYASFCGALLFSKLGRLLAMAPAIFSSAICLQYGDGITEDQSANVSNTIFESDKKSLFPVLEFRVINRYANSEKRAIVNTSVECSVIILEAKQTIGRKSCIAMNGIPLNDIQRELPEENYHFSRHVSYDLKIEKSKLPYVKVWYLRHVLDGASPLLVPEVRREINETGVWPSHLNDHISIRRSLRKFYRIVVNISGTSETTANIVSAKKTYRYKDLYIGWQFAGLLSCRKKDSEGEPIFEVDHSVIHDIVPQEGGGNERIKSD